MKKLICLSLCLLLVLSLCACAGSNNTAQPDNSGSDEKEPSGSIAGVPNPVAESTLEELSAEFVDLTALAVYDNVSCYKINAATPIAEVDFVSQGDSYNYRVALPAQSQDISGMHYEWTTKTTAEVGYNTADLCLTEAGQGVISWYDVVPGVMYSLSLSENATAEKLTELANELYTPVQGEADGDEPVDTDLYADFAALVEELHGAYFPGASGSSLVGAAYAAKLADLFTVHPDHTEAMADMAYEYGVQLTDAQDRASFARQMAGLNDCFTTLSADGIDILDGAGYEAAQYPWNTEALSPVFAKMALETETALYAPLLEDAYAAAAGTLDTEEIEDYANSIFYLLKDCELNTVGFDTTDVDGDGHKELMLGYIGNDNEFLNSLVFGLYAIDESHTVSPVFTSRERDRYYYAGDNLFAHVGSSGADDSFAATVRYENGALTDLETVTESYVTPNLTELSVLGNNN